MVRFNMEISNAGTDKALTFIFHGDITYYVMLFTKKQLDTSSHLDLWKPSVVLSAVIHHSVVSR